MFKNAEDMPSGSSAMNCAQLLELTGWECSSAGARTIRAISPLTLGADGQHAAFYIAQPDETSFYLTDAGETAMHASMFGIELTKIRIDTLNRTACFMGSNKACDVSLIFQSKLDAKI